MQQTSSDICLEADMLSERYNLEDRILFHLDVQTSAHVDSVERYVSRFYTMGCTVSLCRGKSFSG